MSFCRLLLKISRPTMRWTRPASSVSCSQTGLPCRFRLASLVVCSSGARSATLAMMLLPISKSFSAGSLRMLSGTDETLLPLSRTSASSGSAESSGKACKLFRPTDNFLSFGKPPNLHEVSWLSETTSVSSMGFFVAVNPSSDTSLLRARIKAFKPLRPPSPSSLAIRLSLTSNTARADKFFRYVIFVRRFLARPSQQSSRFISRKEGLLMKLPLSSSFFKDLQTSKESMLVRPRSTSCNSVAPLMSPFRTSVVTSAMLRCF
mmetsp:Transcript_67497/g.161987  ORF Transcript_67497/g.161987 Transcript_67497/m.161987 type:complete len:262 (-) Transcript_67497:121-906(-)